MLVDERTNRLIIVGTEEQIVQVEDLLGMLDIAGVEIKLDVMALEYVEADPEENIPSDQCSPRLFTTRPLRR